MIKKLWFLFLIFNTALVHSQTLKTDVLVIGGSPSGVAAAIQSARSKAKTILAAQQISLGADTTKGHLLTINTGANIASGTWGEFQKRIRSLTGDTLMKSASVPRSLSFVQEAAETVLEKMADTVKGLSVYLSASFISIEKDGEGWEARMSQNGKNLRIKARVIIDATETGIVAKNAGAKLNPAYNPYAMEPGSRAWRTAIATGDQWPGVGNKTPLAPNLNPPPPCWCIPMYAALAPGADNLLITEKILPADKTPQYLPIELELGQGVGTIAAYCAFYKTTTKNLKVRIIQGELLDFKGYLLPFDDIKPGDSDWRAIQQVGATGLLDGVWQHPKNEHFFNFMPDSLVRTAEIEPGLQEIYTRAFLWFSKEKPGPFFTIGNTLSFISDYSLTGPVILRGSIKKAWQTQFKFTSPFELNRPITRREFAVLANRYINPFGRTVDLGGRLVN